MNYEILNPEILFVEIEKVAVAAFGRRQFDVTDDSAHGGCILSPEAFIAGLHQWTNQQGLLELRKGFSPICRELVIPEHQLENFRATFVKAGKKDILLTRFVQRRKDEAFYAETCIEGIRPVASEGRLILYSHDALEADGEPTTPGSEWEVVSVNIGPANEPMTPATLFRNYFYSRNHYDPRGKGGSDHFVGIPDSVAMQMAFESINYWSEMGLVIKPGTYLKDNK